MASNRTLLGEQNPFRNMSNTFASVGKHPIGMFDSGILSTLRFDLKSHQTSLSIRACFFIKHKEIPIAGDYIQLVKKHKEKA